ncbi:MAG TPA: BamA/TamA family outer membrane protein [Xanthomonadales bacterium]
MIFSLTLCSALAWADEVEYVISGVDEPMLTNVRNHVTAFRIGSNARLNARLRRKLIEDAVNASKDAMRPYGYFHPVVDVDVTPKDAGSWLLNVRVQAGPPVLVQSLQLELTGPGASLKALEDWRSDFPLDEGDVLDQAAWDKAKLNVMGLLDEAGYMKAGFSRHTIRVDPDKNTARLELVVDTGPQAVMGEVKFNQEIVSDDVLASLRRFQQGGAYNAFLMEKFRLDLWRSGYFEDVEVVERRELAADPPRVDLEVNFSPRKRNTYQSTVGFGTDTLARLQFKWGRHLLSSRGDNFDIGAGWQQKDNQFSVQGNYRLPRKTKSQQFWIASAGIQSETQSLEVSPSDDLENRFNIARGKVSDYWLKAGKTRVRNMRGGFEQLFETVYLQFLNENRDFQPTENVDTENVDTENLNLSTTEPFGNLLKNTSNSLAVGMDWDWPEIRGSGFQTVGHHERAWIFTSNKAWGSDLNFSQVYLSTRWNFLATDRLKILLRAEAGYSDATSTDVTVPTIGTELDISVSDLPQLYRFKAGGSRSVRGYGFQSLDNNGLGSNNILTASAEAEFHFHENWSVAAFVDVGNAFNDWNAPQLKLGTGLGLRWYSVIGALSLDFAQGWDLDGDPWRIHLTIGTILL